MAIAIDIGINLMAEFKQSKSIDNIKRIQRNRLKSIEINWNQLLSQKENQNAIQVNSHLQQTTTTNNQQLNFFLSFSFLPSPTPKITQKILKIQNSKK